jgi:hypothetical protein
VIRHESHEKGRTHTGDTGIGRKTMKAFDVPHSRGTNTETLK